jgi:hypothetical protein
MAMWLMWRIKAVFRTIQGDLPPIVAFSLTIKGGGSNPLW